MRTSRSAIAAAAARVFAPLAMAFALSLFVAREPGLGVGFSAGLVFSLVVVVHALVFGAAAARTASPPFIMRVVLGLGASAVMLAPLLKERLAMQVAEGGLFAVMASGAALAVIALFGRASTLRDLTPG